MRKSKKKEKPEITQTLEIPPEPPSAVKVESSRLVFFVSPLSNKGLLSQQIRDALGSIRKRAGSANVVKLRAFVAGRGDARRVATAVSEIFSEWRQPLPALAVLQVGALPLEGAQLLLEAIAEERKPVNPHGVDFVEAIETLRPPNENGDISPVAPLLEQTLSQISGELLQLTCYVSSLEDAARLDSSMASKFPQAARSVVQAQRATGSGMARCEGVRRRAMGDAEHLLLTGTQIGFGGAEKDLALVENRLQKVLDSHQATIAHRKAYAVSRALGKSFGNLTVVEGVGTNEALFALEAVGLLKN